MSTTKVGPILDQVLIEWLVAFGQNNAESKETNYHFNFIDNNTLLKYSYCTCVTTYCNINNGLLKSDFLFYKEKLYNL